MLLFILTYLAILLFTPTNPHTHKQKGKEPNEDDPRIPFNKSNHNMYNHSAWEGSYLLLKLCLLALVVKNNGRWTDFTLFCSTRQWGSFAFSAKRTLDHWALSFEYRDKLLQNTFTHQERGESFMGVGTIATLCKEG